jgi:hypothetical protein
MKRTLLLLLLLASFSAALCAQERAPAALFEASQCLVTDPHHWVPVEGVKELNVAYLPESKSFGGEKYIYVIVYNDAKHKEGSIFDIRLKDEDHHRVYSIENDASFAIVNKEVKFDEPPLGGSWRQTQLTTTIQQIQKHHKWYEAQVKQLLKPYTHFRCETNVEDMAPAKGGAQAAPKAK